MPEASTSFPVTGWFRSISSKFPRVTFDAVPIVEITEKPARSRQNPILYVQQGHPSPHSSSSSASTSSLSRRWASRDPRCLAWQMQLIFRGIEFDCKHIHEDWTSLEGYHGEGFANVPIVLDTDNTVVGQKYLAKWADSIQPFSVEAQESSNSSLAKTLESVIQGPLLAGVLLELILLPDLSSKQQKSKVPFFSRQIQSHLAMQRKAKIIEQIQALKHISPTSKMPGWITTMHGLLNSGRGGYGSTGTASNVDGGDGEDDEQGSGPIIGKYELDQLEQSSIRLEACEAINLIGTLFTTENEKSSEDNQWLCGSSNPSHLDAILFALLHTIMSLPIPEDQQLRPSPEESLRLHVEKHQSLTKYIRRIWNEYVKPRGG